MGSMMKLSSVILLCAFAGSARAVGCQGNSTLKNLPLPILEEVLSIVLSGVVPFAGCGGVPPVQDTDVKILFNNRTIPENAILLDYKNPIEVDPKKPTKVLIPGWLCFVTEDGMPELRDEYLKREDCNVITIDWTAKSMDPYSKAYCAIPGVGKIIGSLLCNLASLNLDLLQVHLLGHSMGGQIVGFTGQEVREQCSMLVGRITGMDPAGPIYQTQPPSARLDETDGLTVDIIHTNQGAEGFFGPCGSVDFFPNCGTFQPGCMQINSSTSVSDIINLPLSAVSCNHHRAVAFMIESINPGSKTFRSASCRLCPGAPAVGPCVEDILGETFTVMGEDVPSNPPADKFHLKTNSQSPYAQG